MVALGVAELAEPLAAAGVLGADLGVRGFESLLGIECPLLPGRLCLRVTVLARLRSIISASAWLRSIGLAGADSSSPGLWAAGPATQMCCRMSSISLTATLAGRGDFPRRWCPSGAGPFVTAVDPPERRRHNRTEENR
jgi:hypothetical protein